MTERRLAVALGGWLVLAALPAAASDGGAAPAPDAGVEADAGAPPDAEAAPAAPAEPPPPEPAERGVFDLPGEVTSKGEVALETRAFLDDDDALTVDQALALFTRLELRHAHGSLEERFRLFGRLDARDDRRTVLVAEEAYVQWKRGRHSARVGADIVNWTATEAFHPVDVLNARNLDSDLESLEKLGEPMVAVRLGLWEGASVEAFYLPVYQSPVFPSPRSRLGFAPPGVDLRDSVVRLDVDGLPTDDDFGHQGALRLEQTIGAADVAVSVIHHLDRQQPAVAIDLVNRRPVVMFSRVTQAGLTYQHALGALLVKLESAYRHFHRAPAGPTPWGSIPDRDHAAAALGLEYGLAHEGGSESTLLAEGQAVIARDAATARGLGPFQRDVLAGYRFAFNDEASRALLLLAIFDLERAGEALATLAYEQRLGETWTVKASVRAFFADPPPPSEGLRPFAESDHVRLTLTRHF